MKNLNVQELGLEELNRKDSKEINGGIIPFIVIGVVAVGSIMVGVAVEHWWNRKK